jgi:ribosomal protein S12 methylthiotransferase
VVPVIVEVGGHPDVEGDLGAPGRRLADAPEIDGNVYLDGETKLKTGDLVQAKIIQADEYDLWGLVVR